MVTPQADSYFVNDLPLVLGWVGGPRLREFGLPYGYEHGEWIASVDFPEPGRFRGKLLFRLFKRLIARRNAIIFSTS